MLRLDMRLDATLVAEAFVNEKQGRNKCQSSGFRKGSIGANTARNGYRRTKSKSGSTREETNTLQRRKNT